MASADEVEIRELREQIRQLRSLVVSLSATLLRKIAVESETCRPLDSADAQRLIQEAEDCFRCAVLVRRRLRVAMTFARKRTGCCAGDSIWYCSVRSGGDNQVRAPWMPTIANREVDRLNSTMAE